MIEIDYYTLDHATEKTGLSKNDFIALAAEDRLSLYIKGRLPALRFDNSQDNEVNELIAQNALNPEFTHPRMTGTKCRTPEICKIPVFVFQIMQSFNSPPHTNTLHDAINPHIFYRFDRTAKDGKLYLERFNWFISKEDMARLSAKELKPQNTDTLHNGAGSVQVATPSSKDISGAVMTDFDWYTLTLKKDAWTMCDAAVLFETVNAEELYRTGIVNEDDDKDGRGFSFKHLFETSVAIKKLIPLATVGGYDHFKPSDIINWAIAKEIPLPPRLQEWWKKQNKTIDQSSEAINNCITELCSRYHPTNGLKVYYHGMGEWVDVVAISKDPAQTDITRWGFRLTATNYFRLSNEDSITLERAGKVKTNALFPIDPKLDARGQYYFLLPEFTEFKKDDVVADIPPHEYKELCNKYYGDIPKSESDNQADIEQVLTPPTNNKPRKKLKPLIRETNEALLLIHALLKDKGVNYLDELSAVTAWGLIIAQQFKSELIKTYPINARDEIVFNGGDKLGKNEFIKKYKSRFE